PVGCVPPLASYVPTAWTGLPHTGACVALPTGDGIRDGVSVGRIAAGGLREPRPTRCGRRRGRQSTPRGVPTAPAAGHGESAPRRAQAAPRRPTGSEPAATARRRAAPRRRTARTLPAGCCRGNTPCRRGTVGRPPAPAFRRRTRASGRGPTGVAIFGC